MKWIKVKEKLPEHGVPVIVLLGVRQVIEISSVQRQTVTTAENDLIKINTWVGVTNCQVTHWMPMPELPNECMES